MNLLNNLLSFLDSLFHYYDGVTWDELQRFLLDWPNQKALFLATLIIIKNTLPYSGIIILILILLPYAIGRKFIIKRPFTVKHYVLMFAISLIIYYLLLEFLTMTMFIAIGYAAQHM